MRRAVRGTGAAVVVAIAIGVVAAYAIARRSLPRYDGAVDVAGASAPIQIVRDRGAVPHIFASTRRDALFGLGYVHAQDRLWQMEFQRRIGYGRLSEVFGRATLPQDRFLRTVGFGRAARSAWEHLPDDTRQDVDAYVAGVNAFLATHHGTRLPPEFNLLRVEPERWSGPDVIVWQKMMAWDLSKNFSYELLRDDMAAEVGAAKMAALMPPYEADGLSILTARDMPWLEKPSLAQSSVAQGFRPAMPRRPDGPHDGSTASAFVSALAGGSPSVARLLLDPIRSDAIGSNNWVVDGTLTATGRPLLANDPHLDAHIPSTWYLAHLSAPGFDVIGGTLPGTPAVAIGRNQYIAWGETNLGADVQDLYREKIDPTGRFAEYRGRLEPLQIVHESIRVRGRVPVEIDVRISRHGPIVSDAINANNAAVDGPKPRPLEPLAFRWTALDAEDSTVTAFANLNRARNWTEFTDALRDYIVPAQNFVYADVDGHIGYYAPGRIPIRASGDGSRPVDGWTGDAEWTGDVPFDELPHTFDPPEHFIVTANNRPVPSLYPHLLGGEWSDPYRAERIAALIASKPTLTASDFAAFQADTVSMHARSLVPELLARARPRSAADRQALEVLRRWNDDADRRSAAPAILQAWFLRLVPAIVEDDLGPLVTADYFKVERTSFAARFLARTLAADDATWCDDGRTTVHETCEDVVSATLHDAVVDLTRRLGNDMGGWRWDALHRATFPHQGLDAVPVLRWFLSRSRANGGDWSTVNVGSSDAGHPYEQHAIPGYRQVIDLSPANDSRFLDAVGESGHPLSPYYDDALDDWQAVRLRAMQTDRKAIEDGAIGHLTLRPITIKDTKDRKD